MYHQFQNSDSTHSIEAQATLLKFFFFLYTKDNYIGDKSCCSIIGHEEHLYQHTLHGNFQMSKILVLDMGQPPRILEFLHGTTKVPILMSTSITYYRLMPLLSLYA